MYVVLRIGVPLTKPLLNGEFYRNFIVDRLKMSPTLFFRVGLAEVKPLIETLHKGSEGNEKGNNDLERLKSKWLKAVHRCK